MPIVLAPGPGSTLGPGFVIDVSDNITVPNPAGTQWWVSITTEDELHAWVMAVCSWDGPTNKRITIGFSDVDQSVFIPPVEQWWQDGQPMRLLVELREGATVLDSLSQQITLDSQEGLAHLNLAATQRVSLQGGFSDQDRVVLMQINGGLLAQLVDVFLEPTLEWLSQYLPQSFQPIPYGALICDEAILTRPVLAPLVRWIGLRWRVASYPSGLGIVDGFPDHSYAAWGQHSLMKLNDDGLAIAYDTRYESRLEGEILWGTNEPYNVQVYVLPGVCVEYFALSAPPWSPTRRLSSN